MEVVVGARTVCAGRIAQSAFRWSTCVCRDIRVNDRLMTDGFDSTRGPYQSGGLGAGVGLNGSVASSGVLDVGGTLWSASDGGVALGPITIVKQQLRSGGPLSVRGSLWVGADGLVAGDVWTNGTVVISGTLVLAPGASTTGNIAYRALARDAVRVPSVCDCAWDQVVPVATVVAAARPPGNDNAAVGLDAALLSGPGAPRRIDFPCGRYYLTSINVSEPLVLHTTGNTAIFVDGDVIARGALTLSVDPGYELDVFVAGSLRVVGRFAVGSPQSPALTRMYLGGSVPLTLSNTTTLAGSLYAPNAPVTAAAPTEIFGSLNVGDLAISAAVQLHYDRQMSKAGDWCSASVPDAGAASCQSCMDCGNQACIGGRCASCQMSEDCCPPLVCAQGRCVLVLN